jgi:hypothetical protein
MQRDSIKNYLCQVEDEGKKNGQFQTLEGPDINTLDNLPASQGGETGKRNETDESADIYACALRPVCVHDSINDKSKTIEKIGKRR